MRRAQLQPARSAVRRKGERREEKTAAGNLSGGGGEKRGDSPAITVSCRLYLAAPAFPTFGKSLSLRPLSLSSPLRCASSRIRSRLLVSCFCMWPLMFDATIAILHFSGTGYTRRDSRRRAATARPGGGDLPDVAAARDARSDPRSCYGNGRLSGKAGTRLGRVPTTPANVSAATDRSRTIRTVRRPWSGGGTGHGAQPTRDRRATWTGEAPVAMTTEGASSADLSPAIFARFILISVLLISHLFLRIREGIRSKLD